MDPWIVSLGMIHCVKQYPTIILIHDPIHHMNIPAFYLAGLDSATTGLPSQITFNAVTKLLFSDKCVQPKKLSRADNFQHGKAQLTSSCAGGYPAFASSVFCCTFQIY